MSRMTGYKGFGPDWKCNNFQYKIGKEFEEESAKLCNRGFHFCENPLDVLNYYPFLNDKAMFNRFAEVEADDVSSETRDDDTKRVASKLKVSAEIGIPGLVKAAIQYIRTKIESDSATTGDRAHSATTGYSAHSEVKGGNSIAVSLGIDSRAAGALGCWLVLTEWQERDDGWVVKDVRTARVDGEKIKAGVFYCLKNGEFGEVKS